MSSIQRYAEAEYDGGFYEDPDGHWVTFDDHAAIVTRLESSLAAAEKLAAYVRRRVELGILQPSHEPSQLLAAYDAAKETA